MAPLATQKAPPDPAEDIAQSALRRADNMLAEMREWQITAYHEFWDSTATPDAILAKMGASALPWLQAAGTFVGGLVTLANVAGSPLSAEWVAEHVTPRRAFVVNGQTGVVTLEPPADGFDAWGRVIADEQNT